MGDGAAPVIRSSAGTGVNVLYAYTLQERKLVETIGQTSFQGASTSSVRVSVQRLSSFHWTCGGAGRLLRYEVFFSFAATTAGLADYESATKAVWALGLHYSCAIADIALYDAFFGPKFSSAFAFVAFGG